MPIPNRPIAVPQEIVAIGIPTDHTDLFARPPGGSEWSPQVVREQEEDLKRALPRPKDALSRQKPYRGVNKVWFCRHALPNESRMSCGREPPRARQRPPGRRQPAGAQT